MFGLLTANRLHIGYSGDASQIHGSMLLSSTRKPLPSGGSGNVLCSGRPQELVSTCSGGQQGIGRKNGRSFSPCSSNTTCRSHRLDTALRASAPGATQEAHDLGLTVVQTSDSNASAPILSGAGGGIFFWWQLGGKAAIFLYPYFALYCLHTGNSLLLYKTDCDVLGFEGAMKYLQQQHDLTKWQMRGASAGALVACLAACNVDPEKAYEAAHRSAEFAYMCDSRVHTVEGEDGLILIGMLQDL